MTRLNKRLVELQLAPSRRAADELIRQQKVTVNGQLTDDLSTQVGIADQLSIDGVAGQARGHIYLLLNKPIGYVCTHQAQGGQSTIFSLLPKSFASLKIAGRLDRDSQGLLILTSDGDFVQQISHPSSDLLKYYQVQLDRSLRRADALRTLEGVPLPDGLSQFDQIKVIANKRVRLVIHSGRKRQIRRTFAALGYEVLDLRRYQIGPELKLAGVRLGKYRFLTAAEVKQLCRL